MNKKEVLLLKRAKFSKKNLIGNFPFVSYVTPASLLLFVDKAIPFPGCKQKAQKTATANN
jgi:hypothetical protein